MKACSFAFVLAFGTLALMSACGGQTEPPAAPPAPEAPAEPVAEAPKPPPPPPVVEAPKAKPRTLEVKIEAKSGSKLSGKATLTEVDGGVKVALSVESVAPGGDHGAHVHEKGDCSAPDGASAGAPVSSLTWSKPPAVKKRHLWGVEGVCITLIPVVIWRGNRRPRGAAVPWFQWL